MLIISLDIETYGAAKANSIGVLLPEQTVFHPRKSEYIDGTNRKDLILTAAITLPKQQPTSKRLNFELLSGLSPGSTMVFQLGDPEHHRMLEAWLNAADVILGMNLQFDMQYLHYCGFSTTATRDSEPTLVDLSVLNYLHSELREERSLKALGPVLGAFAYSETLKTVRYKRPTDQRLLFYNAQDTHNTMLAIAELSRRLLEEKFEPHYDATRGEYCLDFYSESIWTTIAMSEAGVPLSSVRLYDLLSSLEVRAEDARLAADEHNLILQGPGSATSKDVFLTEVIRLVEQTTNPDIMDALDVTPKSRKVSFSDKNRTTLLQALPEGTDADMYRHCLKAADDHSKALKLISSYCYPLLYHRRNKPDDMSSIVIPHRDHAVHLPPPTQQSITIFSTPADRVDAASEVRINVRTTNKARFDEDRDQWTGDTLAYPTWYVTPSHIKNDSGTSGGTIQGRITCKQPSAQTFPKPIKNCIRSRWQYGKIVAMDLSQAELRVAALLSGEDSMISAYQDGRDLHAERARTLWGDYDDDASTQHQRRQVGKMMNFADLFLSSANTMREQVYAQSNGDISLPVAFYQKVVADRPTIRPQLTRWQRGLLKTAERDHRILLPLTGQSRTFLGDLGPIKSEVVNFPVQTTAGNVTLAIQHMLRAVLPPTIPMFLQIYDAIYLDVPPAEVHLAEDAINYAVEYVTTKGYWADLERIYGRKVPLKHDIEVWD